MFEIEITSDIDYEVSGTRQMMQNSFYIGHHKGDIIIRDPEIIDKHFFIEVTTTGLYVHPEPHVESFLVNGKLSKKTKKIKVGDILKAGSTLIKINQAIFQEQPSFKETLDLKLDQLILERTPKLNILMELEGLIDNNE